MLTHGRISRLLVLSLFLCAGLASADPNTAFKKLESLVGNWHGTYQWIGGRGGNATATYSLTGNGSALVENLYYDKDPVMTSVYHMDSGILRMTHFCASGNQPRLKAVSFDDDERVIQFDMIDITNLSTPLAPHVHAVKLVLESESKISITFSVTNNGKESTEEFHLERNGASQTNS